jgi:hypothetical protein
MKHKFRDRAPNGKLDPKRLEAFEKKIGHTLPEPYRSFLLANNGCEFGSEEMPTTFYGLHDDEYSSIDGPTYPNEDFLPPEVLTIGMDYGDTSWLIGLAGEHRGKALRSREGSDWEEASEGGDVWENVHVVAADFPGLLDLIVADGALADGDAKLFDAWLDEGHGVDEPVLGQYPLETALFNRHLDLARHLLRRGADPMKFAEGVFRPMEEDSLDAVLLYADALPDLNAVLTGEGWTLLDLAVWQEVAGVTKALLERGAKPSKETFRLAGKSGKAIRDLLKPYKP